MRCTLRSLTLAALVGFSAACCLMVSSARAEPAACAASPGCEIAGGRYLARAPAGWDGKAPLPVLVFYHGWRESAEYVMADAVITAFAARHKLLLIAPHGEGQTWSYPGSPSSRRDEFAFAQALFTDIARRFPVEPGRTVAAGFSQGGSMVWNLACRLPGLASHFAAISGGFWEPSPAACSGAGVNLVHVHGLNDGTVPMGGRMLRGGAFRQADIRRDWAIWLAEDGCGPEPQAMNVIAGRQCRVWSACARPKRLAMCLHESGHETHDSDLEAVWAFVEATPANR
jgi:polyhydroxybutyrate depolymerase